MKLTPEQIDQLYAFTRQHYVEYYDLQTELIDHLANAIEQQWQENPKISFEDALQAEFKKFGVFGFTDVVEQRRNVLENRYRKLVMSHLIDFFKIPTIILTVLFVFLVFSFLKSSLFLEAISILSEIGLYIFPIIILVAHYKWKKRMEKDEKKWMFKEMIHSYGFSLIFVPFGLNLVFKFIFKISPDIFDDLFSLISTSFFVVLYVLSTYIMLKVIPSKAEQYLKETYPEYEISK